MNTTHLQLAPYDHNATPGAQGSLATIGLVSLGIGVASLVVPGPMARVLGMRDVVATRWIVRVLGLSELVSGAGLLMRALKRRPGDGHTHEVYATASVTINTPPERVYEFWRDLSNLPRFMTHLESVELGDPHPHFRARLPAGIELEWDAEITADRPNERIQWSSLPGSDIENHGMVRFLPAPGDRGTEVHVLFSYEPPAGAVGRAFVKLFGNLPAQHIRADLKRLKQLLETGDIAQSKASAPRGPHAARPPKPRAKPKRRQAPRKQQVKQ